MVELAKLNLPFIRCARSQTQKVVKHMYKCGSVESLRGMWHLLLLMYIYTPFTYVQMWKCGVLFWYVSWVSLYMSKEVNLSFIWSSWNGGQELTGNKQYSASGDAITWSKRISILHICAHNSQMAITFLISHMLACARLRTSIVTVLQLTFDIQF
jgi:hypothetical protein